MAVTLVQVCQGMWAHALHCALLERDLSTLLQAKGSRQRQLYKATEGHRCNPSHGVHTCKGWGVAEVHHDQQAQPCNYS